MRRKHIQSNHYEVCITVNTTVIKQFNETELL